MNDVIDIVLPWVDGSDPAWQAEKLKWQKKYYLDEKANSNIRYESWDNLHYWFRAVEKFMPWVHKIFLITWGHIPDFLHVDHPKVRIVKHADYIPQEYLPTFKSGTIEMNVHRIEELSENYILFNDDVFPLQPIKESYYFKNNIVCDEAVESPIMPVDIGDISRWSCVVKANDLLIVNKHFKKREVQRKSWWKWFYPGYGELLKRTVGLHYWYHFAGFHDPHMPNAMKKSTLRTLWETEKTVLDAASKYKFRGNMDVSQYLIRYWQLCSGEFYPRRTLGKSFLVQSDNYRVVAKGIRDQAWRAVSLNEDCTPQQFIDIKKEINAALETILPEKSSFEK